MASLEHLKPFPIKSTLAAYDKPIVNVLNFYLPQVCEKASVQYRTPHLGQLRNNRLSVGALVLLGSIPYLFPVPLT